MLKIRKTSLWIALLVGLTMFLAACGADDPTPTATTAPPPAADAPAADPFQVEWDALIAAAQAEGTLEMFACCTLGGNFKEFASRFKDKFGVQVNSFTGGSRDAREKIIPERQAGIYSIDVWIGGSRGATSVLIPADMIDPIEPLLIHPEVLDDAAWLGGQGPGFADSQQKFLIPYAGDGGFSTTVAYNTDAVDPAEFTSYYDLLDPKWKGRIIARDPRFTGIGDANFYLFHPLLGEDFLRRLITEMDIVFVDDARQATDQLAKGAYDLCLFNCSQEVFAARDQGLPVNVLQHVLKEGEDIGWGANVVWAMNKPPHPAAQKLFINFLLTREGQIMFQDITGSDSLRIDIPKDSVKPDLLRHPGVEYLRFDQIVPGWLTAEIQIAGITFAKELMGEPEAKQ